MVGNPCLSSAYSLLNLRLFGATNCLFSAYSGATYWLFIAYSLLILTHCLCTAHLVIYCPSTAYSLLIQCLFAAYSNACFPKRASRIDHITKADMNSIRCILTECSEYECCSGSGASAAAAPAAEADKLISHIHIRSGPHFRKFNKRPLIGYGCCL